MQCVLIESKKEGVTFTITCDWDKATIEEKEEEKATNVFNVNHLMHMKQCYCRATDKDGSTGDTNIYLFTLYGPHLAPGQRNNRTFKFKEGGNAVIISIITSNPKPTICNLTKNGVLVELFNARVEEVGRRFMYSLSVAVNNFNRSQKGRYTLQLGNNYGDPLKFIFVLKDPEEEENGINWIFMVIAILITIIIAALCMFAYKCHENSSGLYRRKHSVSTDANSSSEDDDSDITTTAHETVSIYEDYTSIDQQTESKSTA